MASMTFSRSTPESSTTPAEAGAQRTSEILHEAILSSVSSVRDSIPKQHREHFNTLRQEIIDFAQAHGIPRDTLAKPDALREAAEHLSIPDLTQLANLLERFQYLLVKKEPWKNEEALEYVEKHYHLEKQYTSQVELLEEVGILENGAITGIDGKNYPIPTLEQIAIHLFERRETLETKHDQGFTKLLLVPFGMSLDTLQETLKQFLLKHKKLHPSFDLDTNQPLWTSEEYQGADIGDSPKLVYYQQSFMEDGHGGKTKAQILEGQETPGQARGDDGRTGDNGQTGDDEWKGWTVHLLQPSDPSDPCSLGFASILREDQGTPQGNENPRPPLEAGKTAEEYLSILQETQDDENSPYHNESGLTPEDWIMAFMIHLTEIGQPLDNHENGTESISYLTGAFLLSSVNVPLASWFLDRRHAKLGRFDFRFRAVGIGARSSVMV